MNNIAGIYKIQSKVKPERCYIGSAVNIQRRWWVHQCMLRNNTHENKKLQNHYNKYGEDDLTYEVIIGCDKSSLINQEQFFMDVYKPYFNIRKKAQNGAIGHGVTEDTRRKIGDAHRGKKLSQEVIQKMILRRTGTKYSEETKRKISVAQREYAPIRAERMKGEGNHFFWKHHTEETKKKISEKISEKQMGVLNPFFGKKHSEETKDKMRQAWIIRKAKNVA